MKIISWLRHLFFRKSPDVNGNNEKHANDYFLITKKFFRIKIITCYNQFAWYTHVPKLKNEEDKFYEVELCADGLLRTKDDVAGPNVKGFIEPWDTDYLRMPG